MKNDLPYQLGFRQLPDPRDAHYPLERLMGATAEIPVSKKWQPGPTLDQRDTNSCFPPKTLIRMADGTERRIDEVRLMDEVLTAEGNIGRVEQLMVRQDAESVVKLSLWGHSHLRATPEHPILTRRGYVAIKDLMIDDWVAMPRFIASSKSEIATASHVSTTRYSIRQERRIRYAGVSGRCSAVIFQIPLPETITLNRSAGRIFGLFLSEGNTSAHYVNWTFSIKEKDTLGAELVELLKSEWGIEAKLKENILHSTFKVLVHGKCWALLFESLCSTGSSKKRLHGDLMCGPPEFQRALFEGWMSGDGYERRSTRQGVTVSHRLAMSMYDIAQGLGMRPSIRYSEPKISHNVKSRLPRWDVEMGQSGEDSYRCEMTDTHVWRKVRGVSVEDYEGPVYNMEVEGDHSYVAEGIGVHNCVGHSCWQFQASEPMVREPVLTPFQIYDEARLIDEWADNDEKDEGTSVRAGLNVLKNHGVIQNYYWAQSADQALEYLLKFGPLVFGTDWTDSMFYPNADHVIRPVGRVVGGHAWLAYAGQWDERFITGLTSWGNGYGYEGSFKLSLYDIDELFKRGGCAAAVVEYK